MEMVSRTYKNVIIDNFKNGEYYNNKYKICYGEVTADNFVDNDNLVLKITYGRNKKNYDYDAFIVNVAKKRNFIKDISNNIIKEIKDKLAIECSVLVEKVSR